MDFEELFFEMKAKGYNAHWLMHQLEKKQTPIIIHDLLRIQKYADYKIHWITHVKRDFKLNLVKFDFSSCYPSALDFQRDFLSKQKQLFDKPEFEAMVRQYYTLLTRKNLIREK